MFTRPAALLVAAAELSAFLLTAGVRLPLKVAAGTLLAAGTARGLQRLVQVRCRQPASQRLHSATPSGWGPGAPETLRG